METFPSSSYPESANSTPHSLKIDVENPPAWEDEQHPTQKVKLMCSYGGKILPRPHDHQLTYIGGETKIVAVQRNIKFNSLVAKLSSLSESDNVSIKYQLPDEDLDALISVTNDDDLDNMMHEYDRLGRTSTKPVRLRLFLFPANQPVSIGGSSEGRTKKEKFPEELNSAPAPPILVHRAQNHEKELMAAPPIQQPNLKLRDTVHKEEVQIPAVVSDQIQKHIEDLQRLRLEEQQRLYRSKSDNFAREKIIVPGGRVCHTSLGEEQPVYMMMRPINQGYYVPPPVQVVAPPTLQPQGPQKVAPLRCTEGISMVRPPCTSEQLYDGSVRRQIYFNGPGGQATLGPPRPPGGLLNHDGGKMVVPKAI